VLVVVTGVAWVLDKLVFLPRRRKAADVAIDEFDRQQSRIDKRFADENAVQTRAKLRDEKLRQPWWLEYTASFFPVILAVFVVRSFVVEPFKIPSGSMMPTLLVGDFILVNKFDYGMRLPVTTRRSRRASRRRAATSWCSAIRRTSRSTTSSASSACRATRSPIRTSS
jgi:signal peptidase I